MTSAPPRPGFDVVGSVARLGSSRQVGEARVAPTGHGKAGEAKLTRLISTLRSGRRHNPCIYTTHVHSSSVSGREIARHPPRPRHTRVGGVAAREKICRAPVPFQASEDNCCDRVAMRGF